MGDKIKLVCIRTHGRWSKGDVASFAGATAKRYLEAKDSAWKRVPTDENEGDDTAPAGGDDTAPAGGGDKKSDAKKAPAKAPTA